MQLGWDGDAEGTGAEGGTGAIALSLIFAAVLSCATLAAAAELRDVRPIFAADSTRLILDLREPVDYHLQAVPANPAAGVPARLYVDLHKTRLGRAVRVELSPSGGPLLRMRGTQISGDVTRLILDVPGLGEYRAFPLLDPFRLVVDVHGTPRAVPVSAQPVVQKVSAPAVRAALPPAGALAGVKALPRSQPAIDQPPHRFTVVVDPGHGGKDTGAPGAGGLLEKDVVLSIGLLLRARLEAKGFDVIMTRDRDVFVSLEERTARAIAAKADLFVSIHGNASPNASVSGIETYYLSNSDDRATIRLAHMENHLENMTGHARTGSDVSFIVSDMIQSYKVDESSRLAREIQAALLMQLGPRYTGVHDLGVKPGPFYVLVGAGMPAVLTEISFVTNPGEARRLKDRSYQDGIVAGLLRGIEQFAENSRMAATL